MKKIISLILSVLMLISVLSLTGCGDKKSESNKSKSESKQEEEAESIVIDMSNYIDFTFSGMNGYASVEADINQSINNTLDVDIAKKIVRKVKRDNDFKSTKEATEYIENNFFEIDLEQIKLSDLFEIKYNYDLSSFDDITALKNGDTVVVNLYLKGEISSIIGDNSINSLAELLDVEFINADIIYEVSELAEPVSLPALGDMLSYEFVSSKASLASFAPTEVLNAEGTYKLSFEYEPTNEIIYCHIYDAKNDTKYDYVIFELKFQKNDGMAWYGSQMLTFKSGDILRVYADTQYVGDSTLLDYGFTETVEVLETTVQ